VSHWQACRELAEGYDSLFSIIYARDHLEAVVKAHPELEQKLVPIIDQLNDVILGAEKIE